MDTSQSANAILEAGIRNQYYPKITHGQKGTTIVFSEKIHTYAIDVELEFSFLNLNMVAVEVFIVVKMG